MPLVCYILISILIALILTIITQFTPKVNDDLAIISWFIIIYGLLLGFSINNFYNRLIVMRDTFINEVTNLEKIFEVFKNENKDETEIEKIKREEAIKSIFLYIENVSTVLKKNLEHRKYPLSTEKLHLEMNSAITAYLQTGSISSINNTLFNGLTTDIKIKKLVAEMNSGDFYINIILFLLFIITIPLMFYKMNIFWIQIILYSCLLIIVLTLIYVLTLLNNPFTLDNNFGINLNMYSDLLHKIEFFCNNNLL